jgi:hypothetical protein
MIDRTKYPFTFDHGKCFNCQIVPNLSEDERSGKKFDGTTWQKGVHLCSSCQWHCALLALEIREEGAIKRELRSLEHEIYDLIGEWVYFDEQSPSQVLERLHEIKITKNLDSTEYERIIMSLQVIINDCGFDKILA